MNALQKRFRRVYIEITNVCNLSCAFCPKTKRAPRFMNPEEFSKAADAVYPYTDYLYLHLLGEPLLHPQLEEILAICARKNLQVNITTNGTLISDAGKILLASSAVRKVAFSLHSFEANAENKRSLTDYLGELFSFIHSARAAKILCELRLWNGGGAEQLNEKLLAEIEREFETVCSPDHTNQKLGDGLYLMFAPMFDWPDAEKPELGEKVFCHGLRDHIGILADGTVVPCCLDGEGAIPLGNLFSEPLGELLSTARAQAIYDGFSRRTAVEALCRRCGYARRF